MNITAHVEYLRTRLSLCRLTRKQLSAKTGGVVSDSWISKFAAGRMTNPRIGSLIALEQALIASE